MSIKWTFEDESHWCNSCNKCCTEDCDKSHRVCEQHCLNAFDEQIFCAGCKYDD